MAEAVQKLGLIASHIARTYLRPVRVLVNRFDSSHRPSFQEMKYVRRVVFREADVAWDPDESDLGVN